MFGRPEIEMVTLRLIKQIHINASWHSNPESSLIYIFSKNWNICLSIPSLLSASFAECYKRSKKNAGTRSNNSSTLDIVQSYPDSRVTSDKIKFLHYP